MSQSSRVDHALRSSGRASVGPVDPVFSASRSSERTIGPRETPNDGLGFTKQPLWGLLLVSSAAVLAFWPVWGDLFTWAKSDAPLGFAVVIVPVAVLLAWRRYADVLAVSRQREPFLDGCVASLALGGAILLLTRAPDWFGVWYWAERDDLLAVPLVFVALIAIVWGFDAVVAWVMPIVVLGLLWPGVWLEVSGVVGPVLAQLTADATVKVLSWLGFGTSQMPSGAVLIVGTGARAFSLSISTACSGLSGVLGVLAVGGPIVFDGPGRFWTRILLIGGALTAALVSNIVRIVAIAAVIRSTGLTVASTVAHPLLGIVFFLLIIGVLAVATPGVGRVVHERQRILIWGKASVRIVLIVVAIALLVAALEWRLRREFPQSGARITPLPVTLLAPIGSAPGWQTQRFAQLTWAEPLFGAGSQVSLFRISQPGQPDVWAQVVLTSDAGALAAHSVLDCDLLHGNTILSSERRDVAPGVPADAIVGRDQFGHEFAELIWSQPIRVDERSLVRRVELIYYGRQTELSNWSSSAPLVKIASKLSTSSP